LFERGNDELEPYAEAEAEAECHEDAQDDDDEDDADDTRCSRPPSRTAWNEWGEAVIIVAGLAC